MTTEERKELLKTLKEHTAYLVRVSCFNGNPMHESILFTGFKTGGYWEVYKNSYESPVEFSRIDKIEIIKELHTFKQS